MAKNGFSMSNRGQVPLTIEDAYTVKVIDCGKLIVLNDGTNGLVLTLPSCADAGAGWNCDILVQDSAASGKTYKISTAGAVTSVSDYYVGGLAMVSANSTAECLFVASDGNSNDHINLLYNTQGGLAGSHINLITDGTVWFVKGALHCDGVIATPFSDT